MLPRVTEDFVRCYKVLRSLTGNEPVALHNKLDRDPQLSSIVHELDSLWDDFERQRRFSKRRFIVQADREFYQAFDDYKARWKSVIDACRKKQWEVLSRFLDEELADADTTHDEVAISEKNPKEWEEAEEHEWDFDPDDSAADLLEYVEHFIRSEADSGYNDIHTAMLSRAAGALKWMRETVDLDLAELERRWKKIPPIVVPEHVSDRHGIEDSRSLFGYLDQIRLAYMIRADLAAIAMCRSATEILIRFHYSNDTRTNLPDLIKLIQNKPEFYFLKKLNLIAKVKEANDIIHSNKEDLENRNRSEAIILEWTKSLGEMIGRVPTKKQVT